MKEKIHPNYFAKAKARCACGAVFEIGSTVESLETEICSQCHPFYTGKEKIVDTQGRVERFKERAAKKRAYRKKADKKAKTTQKKKESHKKSVKAKLAKKDERSK